MSNWMFLGYRFMFSICYIPYTCIGKQLYSAQIPLQWPHNERNGVSNHQPDDCLLKRLFRRRPKKTSKLRVTGLCVGNSPVTGEFPAQRASNAENVFIWWRHDLKSMSCIYTGRELGHNFITNAPAVPFFHDLTLKDINPSRFETVISGYDKFNAMAVDALAPSMTTIIVQFMMSANSRICYGLHIGFVCLYITPSHYHHCANLSVDIELMKCLPDIFCRVCEYDWACSLSYPLFNIWGCMFSLFSQFPRDGWDNILLCLIIII